eukprot:symbB.v1.2.018235.t1/scaffold1444.1/size126574/4
MTDAGADAAGGAPTGPPAPYETGAATAAAPQSLPVLPEEAEAGDGRREESDLLQYSQTLGVDLQQHADLLWVVQEAFNAPLPLSWTEYTDDEGRVYFFNQSSSQSTWEHPMDSVYRELLSWGNPEEELTDALKKLSPEELAKLKSALGTKVVVVGWGPVGHAVVTKLLAKSGGALKITVISEESYPAYNRVKLSSFFEHRDPNKLALSSPEWCRENGVELIFGKATKIDRSGKSVEVESSGESKSVKYDELVIATGSKPFVPPVPGLSLEVKGVFVYRTIADIFQITERAKFSTKAVVIGGGLLGLEAAKAAYDLGLETTILELAPHLMPVQLDLDAGKILQSKIEALGLKVKTGVKILEIQHGDDGMQGVKIEKDGAEEVVPGGLLIVGAGVRPRQELAEACGLELGGRGGIKVDHRMKTHPDIPRLRFWQIT